MRHFLFTLTLIAYTGLYVFFHLRWEGGAGFFILIPLITGALMYGKVFGGFAGILSHPVNLTLATLISGSVPEDAFQPNKFLAWMAAVSVGLVIGHLRDLNLQLATALNEVKTLSGLIPICAACHRMRTDDGFWQKVEEYVSERSSAEFTHGFCPACVETLYPDVSDGSASPKLDVSRGEADPGNRQPHAH